MECYGLLSHLMGNLYTGIDNQTSIVDLTFLERHCERFVMDC